MKNRTDKRESILVVLLVLFVLVMVAILATFLLSNIESHPPKPVTDNSLHPDDAKTIREGRGAEAEVRDESTNMAEDPKKIRAVGHDLLSSENEYCVTKEGVYVYLPSQPESTKVDPEPLWELRIHNKTNCVVVVCPYWLDDRGEVSKKFYAFDVAANARCSMPWRGLMNYNWRLTVKHEDGSVLTTITEDDLKLVETVSDGPKIIEPGEEGEGR